MSITEELRMYVQEWRDTPSLMDGLDRGDVDDILEDFIRIADRIDERYKRDMATAQQVGYNEGEDAAMRSGWVELPKDADGVLIHVGDELTDGEYTFTVYELAAYGDGSWSIRNEDGNAWAACDVTHRKPDSWERIMDDAEKLARGDNAAVMELVERCRRLAGEGA